MARRKETSIFSFSFKAGKFEKLVLSHAKFWFTFPGEVRQANIRFFTKQTRAFRLTRLRFKLNRFHVKNLFSLINDISQHFR